MHLMLDCGLMARQLPKSLGNIFKTEIYLDIVETIDNLRKLNISLFMRHNELVISIIKAIFWSFHSALQHSVKRVALQLFIE